MKDLLKAMDDLPWIVKLILCIPALDIVWAVYRIIYGVANKSVVNLVVGILCIVPGAVFVWIIDLVCVILKKKIWIF